MKLMLPHSNLEYGMCVGGMVYRNLQPVLYPLYLHRQGSERGR